MGAPVNELLSDPSRASADLYRAGEGNAGARIDDRSTLPAPGFSLGYRRNLDGIRAIALVFVIGVHMHIPGMSGGYFGVDLFFILSGFLITAIFLEEWKETGRLAIGRFYLRRALRLLPVSTLVLVTSCVYASYTLPAPAVAELQKAALYASVYVMNWAWALGWVDITALSHTWSLSLEEQYYIVWPVLLLTILVLPVARRLKIAIIAAGIVACWVLRLWLFSRTTVQFRNYLGTDARADGLLFGCLLAMLMCWNVVPHLRSIIIGSRVVALVSVVYLLFVLIVPMPMEVYVPYGLATITLASALIVFTTIYAPSRAVNRVLESAPLTWLSKRSYSLYLWHLPVLLFPLGPYGLPTATPLWPEDIPERVFRISVAFVLSALSYKFIELPCLRLKDLFKKDAHRERRAVEPSVTPIPTGS